MLAWYVALTRPSQSRLAEEHLRLQGFEFFNPKIVVTQIVRGAKRVSIRQYVPGYIFLHFDAEADWWYPITGTRGIRRLISATPLKPIPISDFAMRPMLTRCDADGIVREAEVDSALQWLGKTVRVVGDHWKTVVGLSTGRMATGCGCSCRS